MPVLSDKWIKKMPLQGNDKAFCKQTSWKGKISFGLSSYGCVQDFNEFKILQMLIQE